jgi:16S rRNA G1207 methylase RsmC
LEDRVTVLKSDVLSALPEGVELDAIYSNPPLNRGFDFLEKLAEQARDRLKPGGLIELVVYKGEANVLKAFGSGFKVEVVKRSKGYSVIKAVKG